MTDASTSPSKDEWNVSWEAHHREQLTWGLNATPAQRLAWLEEAIAFAYRIGVLPSGDAGEMLRRQDTGTNGRGG